MPNHLIRGGFSPYGLAGLGDDFSNTQDGIPGAGAATYPGITVPASGVQSSAGFSLASITPMNWLMIGGAVLGLAFFSKGGRR